MPEAENGVTTANKSTTAIVGLALGAVSVIGSFALPVIGIVLGLAAIIFSIIGRRAPLAALWVVGLVLGIAGIVIAVALAAVYASTH